MAGTRPERRNYSGGAGFSDPAEWDYRKDSPDFLHAVITEVESKHAVDPRRVYLFGDSVGAVYALYLSIVESEYFAATAIRDGFLPESNFKLIDSSERRTPISIWASRDDTSFPFPQVKATRDAFNAGGFAVELTKSLSRIRTTMLT